MAPFYIMTISAVAQYVGEFLQDTDKQIKTGRFVVSEIGPEYKGNYLETVESAKNGTGLDVILSFPSFI